jgi:hypothetical protein
MKIIKAISTIVWLWIRYWFPALTKNEKKSVDEEVNHILSEES